MLPSIFRKTEVPVGLAVLVYYLGQPADGLQPSVCTKFQVHCHGISRLRGVND